MSIKPTPQVSVSIVEVESSTKTHRVVIAISPFTMASNNVKRKTEDKEITTGQQVKKIKEEYVEIEYEEDPTAIVVKKEEVQVKEEPGTSSAFVVKKEEEARIVSWDKTQIERFVRTQLKEILVPDICEDTLVKILLFGSTFWTPLQCLLFFNDWLQQGRSLSLQNKKKIRQKVIKMNQFNWEEKFGPVLKSGLYSIMELKDHVIDEINLRETKLKKEREARRKDAEEREQLERVIFNED